MDRETLLAHSRQMAHAAHDSIAHRRKYIDAPYWVHTDEVRGIVAEVSDDTDMLIAADHHDTLEDVFPENRYFSYDWLKAEFGQSAADLVIELTDVFTKENYPQLNRKARKAHEALRLSKISPRAQTIKYADLIANTRDIVKQDAGFARTYLKEKAAILRLMTAGNRDLYIRASLDLSRSCGILGC